MKTAASLAFALAAALFVQPAAATTSRWFAGRRADRHGAAGLVLPYVAPHDTRDR